MVLNSHFLANFLRIFSPSAEVQGHGPGQEILLVDKDAVNVTNIEPIGNYAIKLYFDDGHNTGLYSWKYLYKLGKEQAHLWKKYLDRLQQVGYVRKDLKTKD